MLYYFTDKFTYRFTFYSNSIWCPTKKYIGYTYSLILPTGTFADCENDMNIITNKLFCWIILIEGGGVMWEQLIWGEKTIIPTPFCVGKTRLLASDLKCLYKLYKTNISFLLVFVRNCNRSCCLLVKPLPSEFSPTV